MTSFTTRYSAQSLRDPKSFQFDLAADASPPLAPLKDEVWFPLAHKVWPVCTSARLFDPTLGIRTIVIHATAGGSSAGAFSVMRDARASFHWLIPDEDEAGHGRVIWATAPETRACWHVRNACRHPDVWEGKTRINHSSLAIEIVNRANGEDPFSSWQVDAAARIVRYAWGKYPNLRHVVSHAKLDPNRRTDPGADFPWERFEAAIKRYCKRR